MIAIIASLASVGTLLVAWQALGSQRRKDRDEMLASARRRDDAIMSELRSVREGQVRLETLWSERDKSAAERRRDWVREAEGAARKLAEEAVEKHSAACQARRERDDYSGVHSQTDPKLRVFP